MLGDNEPVMTNIAKWIYRHYVGSNYVEVNRYARRLLECFIERLPAEVWKGIQNGKTRLQFIASDFENELGDPTNSFCLGPYNGLYTIKLGTNVLGDPTIKGGIPWPRDPIDEWRLAIVAHEVAHAILRHSNKKPFIADKYFQQQYEADALAALWGFDIFGWLEEMRYSQAWLLGKERRSGDSIPWADLSESSKKVAEEFLEDYQNRIQNLKEAKY